MTKATLWDARARAPKIDGFGLHAVDCACPRCEDGYRPTDAERARARSDRMKIAQAQASAQRAGARTALAREATEARLRKLRAEAESAAPPPPGGYRQWRREQDRQTIEEVLRDHAQAGARHVGRREP